MSASATYISQTYFLPLSTSPFNSTITRLCRNSFLVQDEQYSPTMAPGVAFLRAYLVTSMPLLWRTHCSKHTASLKNGKAILVNYLFFSPYPRVFVFATHMFPRLFQKRHLLAMGCKSRAHHPESHM